MNIVTRDDWVTAQVIVRRILGEDATDNTVRTFNERCAVKPDFPKPAKFGRTKIWCWGEVSDYFRNQREKQGVGRPRKTAENA